MTALLVYFCISEIDTVDKLIRSAYQNRQLLKVVKKMKMKEAAAYLREEEVVSDGDGMKKGVEEDMGGKNKITIK